MFLLNNEVVLIIIGLRCVQEKLTYFWHMIFALEHANDLEFHRKHKIVQRLVLITDRHLGQYSRFSFRNGSK